MNGILYRTTPTWLVLNIIVAIGLAILGNAIIFSQGWGGNVQPEIKPEGLEWVDNIVGFVWIFLFAFMATARWLVLKSATQTAIYHSWLVTALIIFCWLYPFYTLGLSRITGLIGNIVTIILASWVAYQIKSTSLVGAILISTVIFWVAFATVYLVRLIQLNI